MTNKRILVLLGVLVVFGIAMAALSAHTNNTQKTTSGGGSTQYTDAVTGLPITDITDEALNPAETAPVQPVVDISGIDTVYSKLSSDQAANAQMAINDFLLARSGLSDVHAGVKAGTTTQSGNTVQFTLVVAKPQVTYDVTIDTTGQFQTVPNVSFKQAGQ